MSLRKPHSTSAFTYREAIPLLLAILFFCAIAWGEEGEGGGYEQRYYNIKAGPVLFTLNSGLSLEYNDNINLSNGITSPRQSDIIVRPHFGIDAVSELQILPKSQTDRTTLGVSFNVGTRRYMQHPELNRNELDLNVSPDSELSFLIRTGHFHTRLYERFALDDDPSGDGTLSNVAVFRRINNHVGARTTWNMNSKTSFSLGYDHGNLIALDYATLSGTAPTLGSLDNSTDQLSFTSFSQIFSLLGVGFNASAMSTNFPGNPNQNMTTYSYGPFLDARFTQYTTLHASYSMTESQEGSLFYGGGTGGTSIGNGDNNFQVSLTNHLNTYYTQTFSVGRQTVFNLLGNLTTTDSISYTSGWRVNSKITLTSSIFAEDSTDQSRFNRNPHYKRYGCSFGTGYQLSRKMSATLTYQYSKKISDFADQDYQQNTMILNIKYAF
jgi:hypothetical protein